MEQTLEKKELYDLLCGVYKNVQMAQDSLLTLMPDVDDPDLKEKLTVQLSVYDAYASRAAKRLSEIGESPKEEGILTRTSAKIGNKLNRLRDPSPEHIVEMIIEGTTMGINDALKLLRIGKAANLDPDELQIAEDLLHFEEKTIEEMKDCLR